MNRFFPLPLYQFIKIAIQNGGFTGKGLLNISPWLLKTILFEPLRWIELTQNKKIQHHTITQSPIFILGYYRSGTTYLHQSMIQDDRFGYLSTFELVLPEIMLCSEKWLTPVFEFISKTFKLENKVHRVPMTWYKYPGEEDVSMTSFMYAGAAQWGYFFPQKMNAYFEKYVLFENASLAEVEEWKQALMLLLKKVSLASHGKQLVLKSPPQTARIKHLLSLFPGARFIHIHRNPYDVYASNKRLWTVVKQIYSLGSSKSFDANSFIIDSYVKVMQRYLQEKSLVPANRLVEIRYEDFIKGPVETMRHIYTSLEMENFDHCEKNVLAYTDQHKNYAVLKHQLTEYEIKLISEKWGPIITELNYPAL